MRVRKFVAVNLFAKMEVRREGVLKKMDDQVTGKDE